ncbi:MAG: hemin uptake protein HemP [Burkholderiaceae bacterium]
MLAKPILTPETPDPRAAQPTAPTRADAAPVESVALFQGQRTAAISHNGEIYRLHCTRLGKLILTK